MANGAGPGPGLKGEGSQHSVDHTSTGDATPGSGTVDPSPSSSKNVAGNTNINFNTVEKAPVIIGVLLIIFSLTVTLSL